jgi:hypothetical protein
VDVAVDLQAARRSAITRLTNKTIVCLFFFINDLLWY